MTDSNGSVETNTHTLEYAGQAPPEALPPESRWTRFQRWLWNKNPNYKVGTLQYTGFGLIMVFIWLLWGDFIFSLMDGAVPHILPLKLKEMGVGDTVNQILNKSFAYTVAFLFAPAVSFRSDRTRTRWGRRIPYLIWATPFVGLFLVGIGCYESIINMFTGGAAEATILGFRLSQAAVTVMVFGALLIGWDFANIFANTVYWYLFNDVVPSQYMSRFLSLFRIVGGLAGMVYSKFVFPHALDHFRVIFIIAGIAYVAGFLLMCFCIREGQYPPPPKNLDQGKGVLSAARTYARECFTHRLYWLFFLANTCTFMCGLCGNFGTIRNKGTLGITMQELGDLAFWTTLVSMLLQYPAGWLADKWNPLRVYVITHIVWMVGSLADITFIFKDFGPHGNLVFLYVTQLSFKPLFAVASAAELPMYMRLLPKDRYGQFCSANGMVRAFAMIFGSTLAGLFIQSLTPWVGEWRYRYIPVWALVWQVPAAILLVMLYKEWKRLGGDESYTPPGVKPAPSEPVETA